MDKKKSIILDKKSVKNEKKQAEEREGKRDSRGVYIPTEDEVISKREWSEINKL